MSRFHDHSSEIDDPLEHDLGFLHTNNNSFSDNSSSDHSLSQSTSRKRSFSEMEPDVEIIIDEGSSVIIPNENDDNIILQNTKQQIFVGPEKVPANRKSSYVWKYMGFLQEEDKPVDRSYVHCYICKAKLKYCQSTSSLLAHLKKHPEITENKNMTL